MHRVVLWWRIPLRPRTAALPPAGGLLYAPYDLTGAKFLWWSWHDTDASVNARWLGVPIGSTMWTVVHGFCFHALLHLLSHLLGLAAAPKRARGGAPAEAPSCARFVVALAGLCALCTPAMMLAMSPFQMHQLRLDMQTGEPTQLPGRPDAIALGLVVAVMGACVRARGTSGPLRGPPPSAMPREAYSRALDRLLLGCSLAYLASLCTVMALGNPASVVSTGVHQEYGACHVPESDLSGYPRFKYLCKEDYDEDYHFGCAPEQPLPPSQRSWYTICGRAHSSHALYLAALVAICLASATSLVTMLGAPRSKAE